MCPEGEQWAHGSPLCVVLEDDDLCAWQTYGHLLWSIDTPQGCSCGSYAHLVFDQHSLDTCSVLAGPMDIYMSWDLECVVDRASRSSTCMLGMCMAMLPLEAMQRTLLRNLLLLQCLGPRTGQLLFQDKRGVLLCVQSFA